MVCILGRSRNLETIRAPPKSGHQNRVPLLFKATQGKLGIMRIGTRAEVWFSNVVASFARYVAERAMPESVPMLMRHDAVRDAFSYAKESMKGAYSFLDRFE